MQMDKNSKAIKHKFIEFISLSNPLYRIILFVSVLLILTVLPLESLESSPNLSPCKFFLGDHCPSEGLTRGVSSLLKLNLPLSLGYNLLSPVVLLLMVILIILDIKKLLKKHY